MPGTFVFKPIEATLNGEAALGSYSNNLDPFCKIKLGDQKLFTHPSKSFGIHPVWEESLVVQEAGEKNTCTISLKDSNKMNPNRRIGKFKLNLDDVYNKGKVTKWFNICKKDRVQGKLLMEVTYTQGNPQSKLFHQSLNPGAAIDSNVKPYNYFDHKIAGNRSRVTKSAQKEVQKELGATLPFSGSKTTVNRLKDPTLNKLHLDKTNPADTGISNPNTMKLGINHPDAENDPSFNVRNNELAQRSSHHHHHHQKTHGNPTLHLKNPTYNVTQKDKNDLKKHLGTEPPSRVNKLKDPTLNQLHLDQTNQADTGMSNPNTMKLGVNHADHDPTFNIRDKELVRHPYENPNYYDDDIYSNDNIYSDDPDNLADTGMSNPNLVGLSGEKLRGLRQTERILAQNERLYPQKQAGPFAVDKITNVYDTSLGAFSHPRDSCNSMISNPNTIREGINHRSGHVKAGIPEWVEPHYHPTSYHHEPFEIDKITRVNDTSLGRASYQGTPQVLGMSNPNTMKMGVNHPSTLPSYERSKEMAKRLPNYHTKPTEVDKVTTVHDTTLGNPYHVKHSGDTEMSNPNIMKSGVNHHSNRNVDEFVDKHVGKQYTGPNEVDKITKVNDTTLGRYHHHDLESEWADTGMSDPNTAKMGVNYQDKMENVHLYRPEGYPNEYTEPYEVDKITKVNDTSLGRGGSNLIGTGMSNPNMIKAGVNHRKGSGESGYSAGRSQLVHAPHYPHAFEIDKITTVHDTSLGRAGKSAAGSRKSSYNSYY